ncbi:somatoliberin isoform X2 [Zonotrichia albicollis]|uniref:somatoliberin isoform X2 n=1 Tax=Zonotrichia albicollis TaxID=44394 RepID=UPI000EAAFAA1|nr:somatoliberin isoform X2 [Zonotrichia albicollis]
MLDKATLLLFLHLVSCSTSSPLYPALRFSPGPVAGKAMSFQLQPSSSLQSHSPLAQEQQEEGFLTDPTEKRMQRHADAIFTDNYRKFLGQISARKFLQTIIGKRLGSESSPGEGLQEFLSRRQSDSILMDSQYQQQMVLRDFLGAILQSHRPQDIDSSGLEGFPSTLAKLM